MAVCPERRATHYECPRHRPTTAHPVHVGTPAPPYSHSMHTERSRCLSFSPRTSPRRPRQQRSRDPARTTSASRSQPTLPNHPDWPGRRSRHRWSYAAPTGDHVRVQSGDVFARGERVGESQPARVDAGRGRQKPVLQASPPGPRPDGHAGHRSDRQGPANRPGSRRAGLLPIRFADVDGLTGAPAIGTFGPAPTIAGTCGSPGRATWPGRVARSTRILPTCRAGAVRPRERPAGAELIGPRGRYFGQAAISGMTARWLPVGPWRSATAR